MFEIYEAIGQFLDGVFSIHEWRRKKRAKVEGKKPFFPIYTTILRVLILFAVLLIIVSVWLSWPLKGIPQNQIDEMGSIVHALNDYKQNHGTYPENLNLIIKNIPIRKKWLSDCWGSPYSYKVLGNGKKFELRSSGRDKNFGTDDDILRTSDYKTNLSLQPSA
jgi:hypothetical protein